MLVISIIIVIVAVAVDRLTKMAVMDAIGIGGKPYTVVDGFFYITCHRNSGAAWGMFKDGRVFFIVLTTVMLAAMTYALIRYKSPLLRAALAFIIGGAIGNYIDRVLVGSVVDFLDFYIFGYNFPTFNAADSSIVLGAALMIAYTLRMGKTAEPAGAGEAGKTAETAGATVGSGEPCGPPEAAEQREKADADDNL